MCHGLIAIMTAYGTGSIDGGDPDSIAGWDPKQLPQVIASGRPPNGLPRRIRLWPYADEGVSVAAVARFSRFGFAGGGRA
ncbi:hypothetical protein JOD64_004223 [Micromonospora luteifusca]|uniref:Uncharacterized protein n=1 Tax=Micromonospora luteifusca TaxID=709860 RepID=A0ABS2LXS7_9ACTN|nr:hypothetical protein [Micromonospora luteifusca]